MRRLLPTGFPLRPKQRGLCPRQIFGRIHADGVVAGLNHLDGNPVFEDAQLLQPAYRRQAEAPVLQHFLRHGSFDFAQDR